LPSLSYSHADNFSGLIGWDEIRLVEPSPTLEETPGVLEGGGYRLVHIRLLAGLIRHSTTITRSAGEQSLSHRYRSLSDHQVEIVLSSE